jgi:hypothetical protein
MTLTRFRNATIALIGFNLAGTVATWTFHLAKPGTSAAHAVLAGTEFTAPLLFVAVWIVFAVLLSNGSRSATASLWLMTLFAVGFVFGDLTELFKHNIGVSAAKWHLILAADVLSLAFGVTVAVLGVVTIVRSHRDHRSQPLAPAAP